MLQWNTEIDSASQEWAKDAIVLENLIQLHLEINKT